MAVLFVCLGNICRSPTAEAVFRAVCPEIDCDSAGTGDWHVGDPPYGPMQAAARSRGLEMANLRARQFAATDFDRFDLIIAMDADNVREIEAQRPAGNGTPVRLLAPYSGNGQEMVPDPYYTRDFEETLDIVQAAVDGLVTELRASRND
jgi:protein-tyrosine phosphatase